MAAYAVAFALSGCGGEDDDGDERKRLTLVTPPETLRIGDPTKNRANPADVRSFHALVMEPGSRRIAGRLEGSVITTEVGKIERRVGTVQFTLRDGAIVVSGAYATRPNSASPPPGVTVRRPIVGGTRAYLGASGQATQTALPDGSIRHVLEYEADGGG